MTLTTKAIRDTQPREKYFSIGDAKAKGLILRVAPSGTKTFQVNYRDASKTWRRANIGSVCRKTPFLEFEPASAVKFDPDLTGGFRVKWTWSATFGGKRRAGGDFGAHIGDFRKYRAWRAAGSPVRAALAGFPGDVRQLFVAGT